MFNYIFAILFMAKGLLAGSYDCYVHKQLRSYYVKLKDYRHGQLEQDLIDRQIFFLTERKHRVILPQPECNELRYALKNIYQQFVQITLDSTQIKIFHDNLDTFLANFQRHSPNKEIKSFIRTLNFLAYSKFDVHPAYIGQDEEIRQVYELLRYIMFFNYDASLIKKMPPWYAYFSPYSLRNCRGSLKFLMGRHSIDEFKLYAIEFLKNHKKLNLNANDVIRLEHCYQKTRISSFQCFKRMFKNKNDEDFAMDFIHEPYKILKWYVISNFERVYLQKEQMMKPKIPRRYTDWTGHENVEISNYNQGAMYILGHFKYSKVQVFPGDCESCIKYQILKDYSFSSFDGLYYVFPHDVCGKSEIIDAYVPLHKYQRFLVLLCIGISNDGVLKYHFFISPSGSIYNKPNN